MAAPKFVVDWFTEFWKAIGPDVEAFLDKQFEKWMPKIVEAAVTAMTHVGAAIANRALTAAAQGATDITDNITEAIPGPIDDTLADVFLRPILDRLANRGIVPFAAVPPHDD